jgi:hypothetical protein
MSMWQESDGWFWPTRTVNWDNISLGRAWCVKAPLVAVAWELYHPLHTLYFAGYPKVLKNLGAWDII